MPPGEMCSVFLPAVQPSMTVTDTYVGIMSKYHCALATTPGRRRLSAESSSSTSNSLA